MMKKKNGSWTLYSKDGKKKLSEGSLQKVMTDKYRNKSKTRGTEVGNPDDEGPEVKGTMIGNPDDEEPEKKGVVEDIGKAVEKGKRWARKKIGRPSSGGMNEGDSSGGRIKGTPPRRDLKKKY